MASNIGKTDLDKSRQMREQMEDTFWFKAPSGQGKTWGKSYVRVLPAHANMAGCFYWGVPIHFSIGPGQQNLPCPRRAFGQPCPVCQHGFSVRGKISDEEFRGYMPSWQAYMNVVVLNEDGAPKEDPPRVRVWSVSKKVLDMLLNDFEETGDFTDLESGRDVEVRRRGELFETEYRIKVASQPSKFDHPVVSELRDLQTVSPYVEPAVLLQALEGPAGGDPWASGAAQLPTGGAREPDEVLPASAGRFGSDEEEEQPAGVPPTEEPEPADDARREEARRHLKEASRQATNDPA